MADLSPVIAPMPDPATSAAAIHDIDARRLFLESRDVPCPSCRYNLRGVAADTCPECGAAIELQLAGTRRAWVPPLFMALAFGWLLLAGLMNGTRNGRAAWETAHQPAVAWTTFSSGSFSTGQLSSPPRLTIQSGRGTGVRSLPIPGGSVTIQGGIVSQNGVTMFGPSGIVTPPATGAAWSLVPDMTWLRLGWAVVLVIAGVTGLLILLRHRRRPLSASGWARVRLLALLAFALYGGFHVYWFLQEFA